MRNRITSKNCTAVVTCQINNRGYRTYLQASDVSLKLFLCVLC
jgi:hypothetical protein